MHRFIPDPTLPSADGDEAGVWRPDPSHSAAIKRWALEWLRLPADTPVQVMESACADLGCPVVETVIVVFPEGEAARSWRLQRPRAAVTKIMIQTALRG